MNEEKTKRITPKFLTAEVGRMAVNTVIDAVVFGHELGITELDSVSDLMKRKACHVIILGPDIMDDGPAYPTYPVYPNNAHVIYEDSFGRKEEWTAKYDEIARCKALQLWNDRNFGGMGGAAHLLFSGDTYFWGGVKREGIVVACSGVQPWFDRMIAGMIADLCIGIARDAFERWKLTGIMPLPSFLD